PELGERHREAAGAAADVDDLALPGRGGDAVEDAAERLPQDGAAHPAVPHSSALGVRPRRPPSGGRRGAIAAWLRLARGLTAPAGSPLGSEPAFGRDRGPGGRCAVAAPSEVVAVLRTAWPFVIGTEHSRSEGQRRLQLLQAG